VTRAFPISSRTTKDARPSSYREWREQNPEPDLQALAAKHGGLGNVPPEAWVEFDRAREEWLAEYRERWSGKW
jgi:hypothetical protein